VSTDHDPSPDEEIGALVARLSRPNREGGRVIERAAIMAAGPRSAQILEWLAAASWQPEETPAVKAGTGSGLHGMRQESARAAGRPAPPRRYVSPPA
jgi:hypothetical protein